MYFNEEQTFTYWPIQLLPFPTWKINVPLMTYTFCTYFHVWVHAMSMCIQNHLQHSLRLWLPRTMLLEGCTVCVCVCMCECVYIYIYICICIKYNSRTISCLLSDKFILVLQIILGNYPETLPPWDIYPQDMLLLDKLSKNL